MIRSLSSSRCLLIPLGLLAGAVGCAAPDSAAETAEVAVSGGGVTVDVVTTNAWDTGFNGAVRITNNTFPAPITSFEVVFRLGGSATVAGTAWNGNVSAPDSSGARAATQPGWLPSNPITTGNTWEVGFPGAGAFVSSTVVSVRVNGQAIVIGGGGGDGGDIRAPTVTLASSATSVTTAGSITLTSSATDNVGVTRVEFRDGNSLLSTDTSAPYTASVGLTSAQNGTRTYTARAFDAAGNSATSAVVTITVNIPTGGGGGGGPGYSVAGGKMFRDGVEIKLFGLNWFGLETPDRVLHGLWTGRALSNFLADIKSQGFNALRLPLSPQTINPGFPISDAGPGVGEDFVALNGRDGRTALEYTLAKAQAAGMFVLLGFHTCDPARLGSGLPGSPIGCTGYTLDRWLADMRILATLSRTFPNVVGIDLTNEPHRLSWATWSNLASQAGQAILAINPNVLIWVEGVGNESPNGGFDANWGGNLFQAAAIPGIPANRLVFSPHTYGPSVAVLSYFSAPNYPANMPAIWETLFGHLVAKGFTVVTGEFGGHYTTNSNPGLNDKLWQDSYVNYLISKGITSNFYWAVNPNSGDTGGVFGDDWRTWNNDKLLLLQRLMR
jgi:endoglucanase